jgi:hypothetical protein
VQIKDPDGRPAHRDTDFLAETRTVPREVADRRIRNAQSLSDSQRMAAVPSATPVTIYSEAAAKGTYEGGFYGTARYGPTSFGKYTNFSKAIGDYTKDPIATNE